MRNQEQRVGKLIGTRRWAAGSTLFACLMAAFTPGASVAADLVEVKIGTNNVISDAAFFIANRRATSRNRASR